MNHVFAYQKELKDSIEEFEDEYAILLADYESLIDEQEALLKDKIRIEKQYEFVLTESEEVESKHKHLLVNYLDVRDDLHVETEKINLKSTENTSLQEKVKQLEAENAGLKHLNESLRNDVVQVEPNHSINTFKPSLPKYDGSRSATQSTIASKSVNSGWFTMEATYYGPDCKGCTGITKTGIDVRNTIYSNDLRIIAVDPTVIPLNSIVKVQTPNETFKAIAADIGGDIKQNRIDILVKSEADAKPLGRHNVQMKILE